MIAADMPGDFTVQRGLTYLRLSLTFIVMIIEAHVLQREILLAFWKVHILHHASEQPIIGNWMMKELRSHGYDVSPGTLYPLLKRMEKYGWLTVETDGNGPRARRLYRITRAGAQVLDVVRDKLGELAGEVPLRSSESQRRKKS